MKNITINREKSELAEVPVEASPPRSDPPVERHTHKVVLNVGRKRFELTRHVDVREITKSPARVIEMPNRPALKS